MDLIERLEKHEKSSSSRDSFWDNIANGRGRILRKLDKQQLATFASAVDVHLMHIPDGLRGNFMGVATARQMQYIVDLSELARRPLDVRTFRSVGAASLEIDRLKPIVAGMRRRR